jgi:hypothetical protein
VWAVDTLTEGFYPCGSSSAKPATTRARAHLTDGLRRRGGLGGVNAAVVGSIGIHGGIGGEDQEAAAPGALLVDDTDAVVLFLDFVGPLEEVYLPLGGRPHGWSAS